MLLGSRKLSQRKLLSVHHRPPPLCCILGTCTATLCSWQHCTQVSRVQPLLTAGVGVSFIKPLLSTLISPRGQLPHRITSI